MFTSVCLLGFNLALICIRFHPLLPQEKQRGSLRVYIQEAPWTLLALAKFFNTGIAVGLKIPLTLDVQRLLIPPMMIDEVDNLPQFKYVTPLYPLLVGRQYYALFEQKSQVYKNFIN